MTGKALISMYHTLCFTSSLVEGEEVPETPHQNNQLNPPVHHRMTPDLVGVLENVTRWNSHHPLTMTGMFSMAFSFIKYQANFKSKKGLIELKSIDVQRT